jgi:hypothetical protein
MSCIHPCKALTAVLAFGASALLLRAVEPATIPPERKALECSPRAGLPNFFAKASAGGEIRVAYFGGSITAQPGYRVQTLAHFSKLYPKAKFREINAAIGGTGSDLGVFRLDQDVLKDKPDLMFVEFAVNDGGAQPVEIIRAMEGIVRKTWKALPGCDICFVYTFTEALLGDLKAGNFNRSAATMEMVADRYGIPSIHMGLEAVKLETEGKLLMKAEEAKMDRVSGEELNQSSPIAVGPDGKIPFSKDGVHPYPNTGHRLYTDAVVRSIPVIQGAAAGGRNHTLAEPLDADNYQNTAMLPLERAARTGPWTLLPVDSSLAKSFSNRMGAVWKGEPGAELKFKFKGSAAKIYDLVGPDCGKLEVTINGSVSSRQRFDAYCTYSRLATTPLGSGLDPSKIHEVKVRVLPDKIDKNPILFEKNRADFAKYPEKYAPTNWYAGAIFLVGELVP